MVIHDESISSPIAGVVAPAILRHFYTDKTWVEGETLRQLNDMAQLNGAITVAAFPDLHPGKYGPTGMALLAERLHPLLIGNDIGCGMSLFALDMPLRKLRLDKAEQKLRELEHQTLSDIPDKMAECGLAPDLFPEGLGTIGGGNHFCELQAVDQIFAPSPEHPFDEQTLYLLVHSGSRELGATAFSAFLASDKTGDEGLELNSPTFIDWKKAHDQCVVWASLNRKLIAERAAKALHADLQLIADVPHNLVRFTPEGIIHHKGAAVAYSGDLIPIAGSRASLSYVVRACDAVTQSLNAVSHGAGRKYDRASMQARMGKLRSQREQLTRNAWGGRAICDDRALLVEESAAAYKDSAQVVTDLEAHKLVEPVAAMRPLLTYKKAHMQNRTEKPKDKSRRAHYAKR
ncbi:RNA ligase RtcB family protein [Pseudochrobactrum asaccharolyticum]|uniref:RNA ligase RtcB family protein n=1 Tax=Pseudochrobactrum asaccharolyticum TaxID=354351 RepID=UPI0040412942